MNDYNDMEHIKERAKRIKEIQDADDEKYFVEYRDKSTGKKIDRIPKTDDILPNNRGACVSCSKNINEAVSDDRFCRKCYSTLFPDVFKRSKERNITKGD